MSSFDDNPEVLRADFEVGDIDELSDLIHGMLELASASGGVSGTDFAVDTLKQMKARGIEVGALSMGVVLRYAFGDPEELLSRMEGRTVEELEEMLPGEIGDFAIGYLNLP